MTIKLIAPAGSVGIIQGQSGTQYTIASDGSVSNVLSVDVLPLISRGYALYGAKSGSIFIEAALPADLVSIKAAATPANGAITIAAQPIHARKLQIRIVIGTPTTTAITAGSLVLVGVDQDGNSITETISLIKTSSATVKSTYAYAKLISGTVSDYAAAGSGTGNTLGIGVSNDFGVTTNGGAAITPVSLACVKATKVTKVLGTSVTAADDVAATTTVDSVARTIAPTTAPSASGLIDYSFLYSFASAA